MSAKALHALALCLFLPIAFDRRRTGSLVFRSLGRLFISYPPPLAALLGRPHRILPHGPTSTEKPYNLAHPVCRLIIPRLERWINARFSGAWVDNHISFPGTKRTLWSIPGFRRSLRGRTACLRPDDMIVVARQLRPMVADPCVSRAKAKDCLEIAGSSLPQGGELLVTSFSSIPRLNLSIDTWQSSFCHVLLPACTRSDQSGL